MVYSNCKIGLVGVALAVGWPFGFASAAEIRDCQNGALML